jgi:hypothetical protein
MNLLVNTLDARGRIRKQAASLAEAWLAQRNVGQVANLQAGCQPATSADGKPLS